MGAQYLSLGQSRKIQGTGRWVRGPGWAMEGVSMTDREAEMTVWLGREEATLDPGEGITHIRGEETVVENEAGTCLQRGN